MDEIEVEAFYDNGVAMVRYPDGSAYRLSDVMRSAYPDMEFDDATGAVMAARPPRGDDLTPSTPRKEYSFGDTGNRSLWQAVDDVAAIAGAGGETTRSMLPENWQQTFPDALLAAGDYGLAGLTGLLGGAEAAAGYAGDVVEGAQGLLGIDSRYRPGGSARGFQRALMGMLEGSGYAPEGRMLASLTEAGAPRAAVRSVVDRLNQPGPMPTTYSNPIPGLLGTATTPKIKGWHGTPHEFPPAIRVLDKDTGRTYAQASDDPVARGLLSQQPDRYAIVDENPLGMFDFSKMGTGEGAQAYGWGGYLAEAKPVAVEYRNTLSGNPYGDRLEVVMDGKVLQSPTDVQWAVAEAGDKPAYVEGLRKRLLDAEAKVAASPKLSAGDDISDGDLKTLIAISKRDELKQKLAEAEGLLGKDISTKPLGRLYEAEINASPDQFLDWDVPLQQQSPYVQEALAKLGIKPFDLPSFNRDAALRVSKLAEAEGLGQWAKRDLMKAAMELDASPSIDYTLGRLKQMQMEFGISPDSGPWKDTAQDFLDFVRKSDVYKNTDMPAYIYERLVQEANAAGAIGEHMADAYPAVTSGPKAASKRLLNVGIKGNRHLDAGSRSVKPPKITETADGFDVFWGNDPSPVGSFRTRKEAEAAAAEIDTRTRNYVVFDENLINIVRKYGIAGAAAMLGMSQYDVAQAMEQQQPQGLLGYGVQ